jgi:hypothetical protein
MNVIKYLLETNSMNKIIYQFCLHNYKNQFEMINRISNTLENYKQDMMPIENHSYNLDFFKDKKEVVLVDIIPFFMIPEINSYDFDKYDYEKEMLDSITNTTLNFIRENLDPEKTLVIHLIHSIKPIDNVETVVYYLNKKRDERTNI